MTVAKGARFEVVGCFEACFRMELAEGYLGARDAGESSRDDRGWACCSVNVCCLRCEEMQRFMKLY